jgi:hypothetical protein
MIRALKRPATLDGRAATRNRIFVAVRRMKPGASPRDATGSTVAPRRDEFIRTMTVG